MDMKETWKEIKGFEGRYSVSTLGSIRNDKTNKVLSPSVYNNGYRRVSFRESGLIHYFLVHRLVADAFIDNTENKRTVNHKDGNKLNNNVSNLEWATDKEQQRHAIDFNLRKSFKGKDSKLSRPVYQFDLSGNFLNKYDSVMCAKKCLGFSLHISEVCNGKRKTSGGFTWSYSR